MALRSRSIYVAVAHKLRIERNIPNCVNTPISQGSKNRAAPTVVVYPLTTDMPMVRSAKVTPARPLSGLCPMQVATCTI